MIGANFDFGRKGLNFGRMKLLAPPKKWPRYAYERIQSCGWMRRAERRGGGGGDKADETTSSSACDTWHRNCCTNVTLLIRDTHTRGCDVEKRGLVTTIDATSRWKMEAYSILILMIGRHRLIDNSKFPCQLEVYKYLMVKCRTGRHPHLPPL